MGATIAEKIITRVTREQTPVRAGMEVAVKPDFVMAYDFPGYLDVWFRQMKDDFNVTRIKEPERFAMFIDHMVPGATAAEEQVHQVTRQWCQDNQVPLFDRQGIGHQVAVEQGYAVPGSFSIHFDGHTSQLGAYGALSIGVHKQVLEALVRDYISFKVPHTTRVNLQGRLAPGVMARDVFHHLLRQLGPASCQFQVLELGGDGLDSIPLDGLQTITGLAMFTGAITAIVNPTARMLDYALPRARKSITPLSSDSDAVYAAVHSLDLAQVAPMVVRPPSPANSCDLSELAGLPVRVGYLGSCASGRLDDLRAAAAILRGRSVRQGFRLNIVPTSQAVMAAAAREGLIEILVQAGAFLSSSSCDFCFGKIPLLADDETAVSTGTLNIRGRMGSPSGAIYLCSAATVAATAINGYLTDPRSLLPTTASPTGGPP